MEYGFDRFLRYDDMRAWLDELAAQHPGLMTVESYGRSHQGRDLVLVTLTDAETGPAADKPAHWVDANIHSIEVTGGVAALHLIHRLVTGHGTDETVTRALRTRTFYVAPRVNPDGVEAALADSPRYRRSSQRPWPWSADVEQPGLIGEDVDGDGRVLQMRLPDPDGPFLVSPEDARLMVPVPPEGAPDGTARYRVLPEGRVRHWDGFTLDTPRAPEGLDLNRNFPAGWSTSVTGSGDHPLSEPEIDALVRAVRARPNICGYNAYHTSAGWILRPSSTQPDAKLPPVDVWAWKELGKKGTELTGYPVASVYEEFTWDKDETMSGAADDWAYEHLGIYSWTTEFWDVIKQATGEPQGVDFWYVGATPEQELAVARWADEHGVEGLHEWARFDHPDLGEVEIGGWDHVLLWGNTPTSMLRGEVAKHADFAIHQALAAPCVQVVHQRAEAVGNGIYRVEVGIANTGWLPTHVSAWAKKHDLVLPLTATLRGGEVIGGTARQELGQLGGRIDVRFGNLATTDRVLATWLVRAEPGTEIEIDVAHPRAGRQVATIAL